MSCTVDIDRVASTLPSHVRYPLLCQAKLESPIGAPNSVTESWIMKLSLPVLNAWLCFCNQIHVQPIYIYIYICLLDTKSGQFWLLHWTVRPLSLNSWSKNHGFSPWQEQWENFFSRVNCWLFLLSFISVPPCITTASHERPKSFSQKCRWQVTLQPNTNTPLTQWSWSGLTVLSRHSVRSHHGNKLLQLVRQHLSTVVCGLTPGLTEWKWYIHVYLCCHQWWRFPCMWGCIIIYFIYYIHVDNYAWFLWHW